MASRKPGSVTKMREDAVWATVAGVGEAKMCEYIAGRRKRRTKDSGMDTFSAMAEYVVVPVSGTALARSKEYIARRETKLVHYNGRLMGEVIEDV